MNDWILPGTLSCGPLGTALRAASGDLWILGWGMALLNLCSLSRPALTPHSVHIAINIKRHQRRDWEIGLWARYCSDRGEKMRMKILSVPAPVWLLQKVLR